MHLWKGKNFALLCSWLLKFQTLKRSAKPCARSIEDPMPLLILSAQCHSMTRQFIVRMLSAEKLKKLLLFSIVRCMQNYRWQSNVCVSATMDIPCWRTDTSTAVELWGLARLYCVSYCTRTSTYTSSRFSTGETHKRGLQRRALGMGLKSFAHDQLNLFRGLRFSGTHEFSIWGKYDALFHSSRWRESQRTGAQVFWLRWALPGSFDSSTPWQWPVGLGMPCARGKEQDYKQR